MSGSGPIRLRGDFGGADDTGYDVADCLPPGQPPRLPPPGIKSPPGWKSPERRPPPKPRDPFEEDEDEEAPPPVRRRPPPRKTPDGDTIHTPPVPG